MGMIVSIDGGTMLNENKKRDILDFIKQTSKHRKFDINDYIDLMQSSNKFDPEVYDWLLSGEAESELHSNDQTNPKDLIGCKKDNIHLVPPEGIRQISKAMRYGADKYGPYNWRDNKVQYVIYLDAILRHTLALLEGEDVDPDSGLKHEAHIGANAVLLLDAHKYQNLIDNRYIKR